MPVCVSVGLGAASGLLQRRRAQLVQQQAWAPGVRGGSPTAPGAVSPWHCLPSWPAGPVARPRVRARLPPVAVFAPPCAISVGNTYFRFMGKRKVSFLRARLREAPSEQATRLATQRVASFLNQNYRSPCTRGSLLAAWLTSGSSPTLGSRRFRWPNLLASCLASAGSALHPGCCLQGHARPRREGAALAPRGPHPGPPGGNSASRPVEGRSLPGSVLSPGRLQVIG